MDKYWKVATTGGRDYHNVSCVRQRLDELSREVSELGRTLVIFQGNCPTGADELVRDWARDKGVHCFGVPALWEALGKPAGPVRNGVMLDIADPEILMVFPGGRGTRNTMKQAWARSIPVEIIE